MKLLIGILAILLPVLCQGQAAGIRPLYIGDRLPAVICRNVINSNSADIALSAYKGKVIILDFWATWCSSCIIHLPLMDSLQHLFKDKLQCILVSTATTGDTKEKVQGFLQKKRLGRSTLSLPVVIGDTLLTRLFPHRLLPHYVWINTNGIVSAFTDEDALTAANINTLYNEKRIPLPVKQDVMDYNPGQPLLQDGNGGSINNLLFSGTLTRYLEGLPSGTRIKEDSISRKVTYLNRPVLGLYQAALGFAGNRVMVITADSSRYFTGSQNNKAWHKSFYCYEYIAPVTMPQPRAKEAMAHDLNEHLGLYGRMEVRKVSCYIIIRSSAGKNESIHLGTNSSAAIAKNPSFSINNEPLSSLLLQLNGQVPFLLPKPIFIDETGCIENLSLVLYHDIDNIPALKKELQSYGFDLLPATRELSMFVLSELHQP